MSTREFAQWRYYVNEYPIDDESVHMEQIALHTTVYANANSSRGSTPRNASDYLIHRSRRKAGEDPDEGMVDFKIRAAFDRARPTDSPD